MHLDLNEEEHALLMEELEGRRQELHPEIRRSMDHEFKDGLSRKLKVCEGLLEKLKASS